MNHRDHLRELLEDPDFKRQWEEDEPEREVLLAIARLRSSQGLTQQELAERTGIKQSELSKLENGKTNPTLETLQKIAKGLDMRLELKFVPYSQPSLRESSQIRS